MADKIKNYGITGTAANIQLGLGGPIISGANANVIVLTDSSSNAAAIITAEGTENSHAVTLSQLEPISADKLKYQDFTVAHDGGTYNLANATANTRIVSVVVEAGAAWSNADSNTTITVGDAADADRLFTGFDPEVQSSDDPNHTYSTETTVKAVVTAGGATAGNATVTVWYVGELTEAPPILVPGQEEFLTAGTFSWTAPEGVTSVSAVVVAGGAGWSLNNPTLKSGGGGALAWRNNISVTPGESYTVVVGAGGQTSFSGVPGATVNGGDSYFMSITPNTGLGVWAQGAQQTAGGKPMYTGATPPEGLGTRGVDWDGGEGGDGAVSSAGTNRTDLYPGGGGAGGYGVRNGTSKSSSGTTTAAAPAGTDNGGGGGGGGGGGSAGGVGLRGEGPTGAPGFASNGNNSRGGFGSAINDATDLEQYADTVSAGRGGGAGIQWSAGRGGVRIIWGTGRSYPSTNTGNV